ncbi:MAG TPA: mechanosensitive ion channel [bacterium]|nr:mechanosensitive ion channel [bacterium]
MISIDIIIELLISWFLGHGIKIILILIATYLLIRITKVFTAKIIRQAIVDKDKESEKRREDTLIKIFTHALKLIWLISILTILPEFGINIAPILAGAGLIGLAVGMGAKKIIGDFLSGIFIVLEDQYRIGDKVEISGIEGKVSDITLRRTIIKNQEGVIYSIPNGEIKITLNKSKASR